MAKTSKNLDRVIYLCALFGLLAGAFLKLYDQGQQINMEEGKNQEQLAQVTLTISSRIYEACTAIGIKIQETFITLAIKLLHFFVSRSLQFRYLSPLAKEHEPYGISTTAMVFWVAFTRAISSISNHSL